MSRSSPPDIEDTSVAPTPAVIDLHHLVRKSSSADLPAMSQILAAAFHDDPIVRWMVPDEVRRQAVLPDVMRLLAARVHVHGENHLNDTGTAAAVWSPPHATFNRADHEWFHAELALLVGDDHRRLSGLIDVLDAHRPREPHYRLHLVGVRPSERRRGVGAALVDTVLARADSEGAAAYFVATSPRSRAFAERHGFDAVRELRCGGSSPLWAMWRDPYA
jgi:GNAT superfamily N-acetyltransferase